MLTDTRISFEELFLHHTQIEEDSYDDNILLHHVMRNLDTDDYFSCERVSKSFHRALNHPSTDKVWCYIALKSEFKNNLHFLQNPPAYLGGSGLVEEDYEFNRANCWKDAVCFKRVIGFIRQEQKKFLSCAVVSFNKKRDWCPYQFQKELVLDIYEKYIRKECSHDRPLILREDTLRLLLGIVSNYIQDTLECSLLAEIHRFDESEETELWESSIRASDVELVLLIEKVVCKRSSWVYTLRHHSFDRIDRLDIIIRKIAHRAGILGIDSEAFEYVRRLFCECVRELLKVVSLRCDCLQDSSNEEPCQPLTPSPSMIEKSARFLFGDFSGAHTYYATKEADINNGNDSQIDANDSDSYEPSDIDEESDDDNDSFESSDDIEENCEDEKCVGDKLSQIGIQLIKAEENIEENDLECIISSLTNILRSKRGENVSKKRSRI